MRWLDLAWRSVVIALIYFAVQIGLSALLIGRQGGVQDASAAEFYLWEVVCGLALALTIGLFSQQVTSRRYAIIWAFILFFNAASLVIEGTFFSPATVGGVWLQRIVVAVVASLATAGAIAWLLPAHPIERPPHPVKSRSWFGWGWRFIVSSITYMVTYLVFGAVNYALVTKPYYDAHAGGLTVPRDPQVVLMAETARAPLIVLAVIPLVLAISLTATRRRAALAAGLALFVVGGIVPLLPQTALPLFLRISSLWEIFLQNFVTGLVIGALMGYAPVSSTRVDQAQLQTSTPG